MAPRSPGALSILAANLIIVSTVRATPAEDAARAVFEKRCLNCHGQAQTSGLDLRQIDAIAKGGKRGPAIVPGKAAESLLYRAAAGLVPELPMPPGKPLPASEIAAIRAWIDEGAKWENQAANAQNDPGWWAFRKAVRRQPPSMQGARASNPVDSFIQSKLHEKGLKPARAADKRMLIRRAYFDLHGLPPASEDVAAFVKDPSPGAYEKLIDRLLASPRYGERWGRHWLDVVRYADTGGFETDMYYANAWRYRDYVVKSFNGDKPYNRFVQEQIAGDELWPDNLDLAGGYDISEEKLEHLEARIGTAMYTIGPTYHEAALNGEQLRHEWLTDAVDTTGEAFLGLTLGCARCHDHKFDPISQRDYHRMMAIFAGSEEREIPVVSKMDVFGFKSGYPRVLMVDEYKAAIQKLDKSVEKRAIDEIKATFSREIVEAYDMEVKSRTPRQSEMAQLIEQALTEAGLRENASGKIYAPRFTPEEKEQRDRLIMELGKAALQTRFHMQTATVIGHADVIPEIRMTVRGDFHGTGDKAGPGFPKALGGANDIEEPAGRPFVPQRRKALALWLTEQDHPLTARVMVNRLWAWHFGKGIVGTPGDFGRQGELPAHPELLDWLASEFVAQGWSVKRMHRLIMLSDAYRMSSEFDENNARIDPGNRYVWRMNRQRLDAEQLRDTVLAVAGTLNLKAGGKPVIPPLTDEERSGLWAEAQWPVALDASEHNRRSVYLYVKRSFPFPMFSTFDAPESSQSCSRRDATTVAPQALALFNSRHMLAQAGEFSKRVLKAAENSGDQEVWVERAWQMALARSPDASEKEQAIRMLKANAKPGDPKSALPQLCLVLFNMNEFLYVE